MVTFESFLIILGLAALFETLRGHVALGRAVKNAKRRLAADGGAEALQGTMPSVSVVRPIKGRDVGLAENLDAALGFDYPGAVQTVFVLDDKDDPAYALVHQAVRRAKRDGLDVKLMLAGEPPEGITGKLHAMKKGIDQARHDVIAFADSDTRPDPELLADLVRALGDDKVGASFAPVVVSQPRTAGDTGYALMLNGLYGPFARRHAGPKGELPFIMGQFMAFRRKTLDAIGGVEGTAGELVDDMSIGLRMTAAGFQNVMIDRPMTIVQEDLSLRDFVKVYRRWITFSRTGLPASFKVPQHLRASLFFVQLAVLVAGLLAGSAWAAGIGLVGVLAAGASVNRLYDLYAFRSLAAWQYPVIFVLLLVSPWIYGQVLMGRDVTWRGRTYRLSGSGALARKWTEDDASLPTAEIVPSAELLASGEYRPEGQRPPAESSASSSRTLTV